MLKQTGLGALLATSCLVFPFSHAFAQQAHGDQADSSATSVSEIMVQAERRSEPIQTVAAAVSVVPASQIAATNYTGLASLQYLSPSVQFNYAGGGGFEIRGVGLQTYNTSEAGEVGIVIDDVVVGMPEVTNDVPFYEALSDINHVEVLEGPQGTLFGKNAAAGVIQIVTNPPKLGVYQGDATVSYGSRNELKFNGDVNIPLNDTLAARLSVFDYSQDGAMYNFYTNSSVNNWYERGVRLKLLWQPTDKFSTTLDLYGTEFKDDANNTYTLRSCGSGTLTFLQFWSPCAIDGANGVVPSAKNYNIDANDPLDDVNTHADADLHMSYDFGFGTLTSITAMQYLSEHYSVDVDATPQSYLDIDQGGVNSTEFTQELRFTSNHAQKLEYTAGLFYYYVNTHSPNTLAGTLALEPNDSANFLDLYGGPGADLTHATTSSYAAYGQATYHVTDKFRIIAGLRYTYDDVASSQSLAPQKELNGRGLCQITYAFGDTCAPSEIPAFPPYFPTAVPFGFTTPTPPVGLRSTASNLSGKIGVEYQFTPDVMAYFTYATGYKGPAISFTQGPPFSATPFSVKPELSKDYEVGLKTQWLDRRLTLDIDAFYTQFTNFQTNTYFYDAANPALSGSILTNAGGLKTEGFEGEAEFRPTPEWTFTGNFAYSPATFTSYNIPCATGPSGAGPWVNDPIPGGPASCFTGAGGQALFSAKGYPLSDAPSWTYSLLANYRHQFGDDWRFDANFNWHWRSSAYTNTADANTIVPAYGVLGAELGLGPTNGKWRVSVWGRNLLNQYFVAGIIPTFFDDGTGTGLAHPVRGYGNVPDLIDALRTVGVKLEYHFGS
jgi:iron complex outermembrane receptor protein